MMHRYEYPSLGGLSDVKEDDNLMVYLYNIASGFNLRYRDQICVNTATGSETGEKEGQWDKIHRVGYGLLTVVNTGGTAASDAITPISGLYKIGSKFTGAVVAATGYKFLYWSVVPSTGITMADTTNPNIEMTLNSDAKLIANFGLE
jgi:hypothetical protein